MNVKMRQFSKYRFCPLQKNVINKGEYVHFGGSFLGELSLQDTVNLKQPSQLYTKTLYQAVVHSE